MPLRDVVRRPEAVIFDLDGTLIDTSAEFIAVVARMRAAHGLPSLKDEVVRKNVTNGASALITLALGSQPKDPDHDDLREEFLDHYEAILGTASRPYPGIYALIKHLAAEGIPWGVATNKFRRFAEPLMKAMKFQPEAGSLVTPCDVVHPKPHPESILLSCKNLGATPKRSIYIGDHRRDIEAGAAAGCFTIAAAYGYIEAGENPQDWQADAVVASSEALLGMIMRIIQ